MVYTWADLTHTLASLEEEPRDRRCARRLQFLGPQPPLQSYQRGTQGSCKPMCMTAMITSSQQQATLAAASPLYTQTKTVRAGPQAPRTHALGEPSTHGKWTCPMPYNTHSCTIALPPAIGRRPVAPWSTASSVPRTRWHGQCRLHTSQHDQTRSPHLHGVLLWPVHSAK